MDPRTREELDEMCREMDYHMVQSAEDFLHGYNSRYGYHWTKSKHLPEIQRCGLGIDKPGFWADEHELDFLYCMGTGDSAQYVDELLKQGTEYYRAIRKALDRFFPCWYRIWFSFDPKTASGWGDTLIRIDLVRLGNWISDNHVEAFMYPDNVYGHGLFMEKRIPVEFLRWKGQKP